MTPEYILELKQKIKTAWDSKPPDEPAKAFDYRLKTELGIPRDFVKELRYELQCFGRHSGRRRQENPPEKEGFIVSEPIVSTAEVEKVIHAERQRMEAGAHRYALKRAVVDRIKHDNAFDMLEKALKRIPPPPRNTIPHQINKANEEIIVVISDCQVGQRNHKDYVAGLARFDSTIFLQRADRHRLAVSKIIRDRAAVANITQLRVFLLGDIIDGDGIFASQPYEIDQTVVDQAVTAFQTLSGSISDWSTLVPRVSVHAICGNHGLVRYNGSPRDNWEYLVYKLMEMQLKEHSNVAFNIDRSPFSIVNVMGWGFLLTHGDEIKGRIPLNHAARLEGDWRAMLKTTSFDYYIFGHHHRQGNLETNGGEIFCNGCWPGGSGYSIGKLQLLSRPTQLVFGLTEDEGITWRYRVDLDRAAI